MAIGHKILIAAYHMLATGRPYRDLGATYLDGVDKRRTTRNLVRRLERLGYEVTLGTKAAETTESSFHSRERVANQSQTWPRAASPASRRRSRP